MTTAAVVNITTLRVVNIILADERDSLVPDGFFLINLSGEPCGIGWDYSLSTRSFTAPAPPPPEV